MSRGESKVEDDVFEYSLTVYRIRIGMQVLIVRTRLCAIVKQQQSAPAKATGTQGQCDSQKRKKLHNTILVMSHATILWVSIAKILKIFKSSQCTQKICSKNIWILSSFALDYCIVRKTYQFWWCTSTSFYDKHKNSFHVFHYFRISCWTKFFLIFYLLLEIATEY